MPQRDNVDLIHEQVVFLGRRVAKESEDLDYIINKIQTSVDFVAVQARETIKLWQEGKVYPHRSLEDLKHKFRLDTYSIEDGWELLCTYPNWIQIQRAQLLDFIWKLGGEEKKKDDKVLQAIERVEKAEWDKDLEMDMGVIFSLQEIKEIFEVTMRMEYRLKALEKACKKRSGQIISPHWEPKGLL